MFKRDEVKTKREEEDAFEEYVTYVLHKIHSYTSGKSSGDFSLVCGMVMLVSMSMNQRKRKKTIHKNDVRESFKKIKETIACGSCEK